MTSSFSERDASFRAYALEAPVLRVVLTTCAPLALFQFIQSAFKILDTLMASYIGSEAVSAVACLNQITLMVTALGSGLAVGGSIKISEAYGRGDYENVRRRAATVYALAVMVSLLAAMVLIPFAEPFLRLFKTPEALIATGSGYFRIEILTLAINFFNTVYLAIERSRGNAKKILILNFVVVVVKLGFSAFFVYVLHGGLVMIAVATLISQALMLLYALVSMARDEGAFQFRIQNVTMDKETILPVLNLSYPVAGEKMLFAGGKVVMNAMSVMYGSMTVGAMGVSNNIGGLTTNWHVGFTDGGAPLISQNRGAGKYRRTLRIFLCLLVIDAAIGGLGILLVSQTLPWLAELFARSKSNYDPAFRDAIVTIHRWEMLGYITLGIHAAASALLLGYGHAKTAMFINGARVFLFRVPVLWVFQHFTALGMEAVGLTMMISNISTGLLAVIVIIPVIREILCLARGEEG